ncbi:MAG: RsmB/NOP family class I SAM-dependent RNA methyltransferase [Opitutales bacterium]
MSAAERGPVEAWPLAARTVARWLDRRERVDTLLESVPAGLAAADRARCQHLVYGVVRHFGRLDAALLRLVSHPPRFATRAVLLVAGFELIEATGASEESGLVAKIVHHAVEQAKTLASPAEARMVNAVVRKLAPLLAEPAPPKLADATVLAGYFSHPEWLVRRWLLQFGAEPTRQLLEWNQAPARLFARWRDPAGPPPAFLKPTDWPGYYEIGPGHWPEVAPLVKGGSLYLQDPATRLAVELLAPQKGEPVLDLCAAPGGKSLLLADQMESGRLVALDLPGSRIDRLKENLARARGVDVALVQADLLTGGAKMLAEHNLLVEYPAVLLDVPCSNTGVMRHRVDVKWRLQEGDLRKHPRQQLALLHAATRLVAPGGRLVYSTCSIEPEENERVVAEFFKSRAGEKFSLEASAGSFPWVSGHDGAGAFRLRRRH